MNRYSVIRERVTAALQTKTGWGRNEILAVLDEVLLAVADEELSFSYASADQLTTPPPLPQDVDCSKVVDVDDSIPF